MHNEMREKSIKFRFISNLISRAGVMASTSDENQMRSAHKKDSNNGTEKKR